MKLGSLWPIAAVIGSSFHAASALATTCTGYPYTLSGSVVDTGGTFTNNGSITYDGTGGYGTGLTICPDAVYTNSAGADIDNSGWRIISYTTGRIENHGLISASGQGMTATVNNYGTGQITVHDLSFLSGGINNSGGISVDNGSQWWVGGLNNNVGGLAQSTGYALNSGVVNNAGTLRFYAAGSGTLTSTFSSFTFNNGGTVNNAAGGLLSLESHDFNTTGQINNSGTLSILQTSSASNAGVFENRMGTVTNLAGGTINVGGLDQFNIARTGLMTNSGTLNNQGHIVIASGSGLGNTQYTYVDPNTYVTGPTYTGNLGNTGTITINNGGTLSNSAGVLTNAGTIDNSGAITNAAAFTVTSTGAVIGSGSFTQTAGTVVVDGLLQQAMVAINGGTLKGDGSISGAVTVNGGTVSPGHSPGLLTFNDSLSILSGGISVDIGGTARGTGYSAINAGSIALGGTLNLNLVDLGGGLFAPNAGDTFDLLEAASITGDFSHFTLASLANGLTWQHSIIHLGNGLQAYELTATSAVPVPAAFWLLGSGLAGLAGVARKRRIA